MDVNVIFESAKLAVSQGNKFKARSLLREIIKAQPRNEAAWLLFAEVAEKPEHTIKCLEQVIRINPNNMVAREKLAKYHRTANETISHSGASTTRIPLKTDLIIGVGVVGIGLIVAIAILLFGNTYKPNPDDAFSYAAGYALSEMYAKNPSQYECVETESKKAVYWYLIKVSDLGHGKYSVIGAMKAIDEFCGYNSGYFATTVSYNYESKDWNLSEKVYFSNPCMTLSYSMEKNGFANCTFWKYDWAPDMNWRPPSE